MTKIAFVTPWYGPDIPGGAEAETRRTAEKLAERGVKVEILTTCIRDFYADWSRNHHRPGTVRINGVLVRRFPVQKRDKLIFDQINWRLMNDLTITREQEKLFISEMIRTPKLYEFIDNNKNDYLFFLIPYMFSTTYHASLLVPQRSIVIPCLHDENYARLSIYNKSLPGTRAMLLHTDSESDLASKLFGPPGDQLRKVIGEGIDTEFTGSGERFRRKYGLQGSLVLNAGRREAGKNTPMLLNYWQQYVHSRESEATLVMIGPGQLTVPKEGSSTIVDLGYISTQDKFDALAAADVFCLPSERESFSIVIMESWLAGTPVLVHAQCAVTREHCLKANGGLYFEDFDEFAGALDYLLENTAIARRMGQQGRGYVLENYNWERIIDDYLELIEEVRPL